MKPRQQHKDPRITNISFDNFTGSISIIASSSSDDDETKELMLSSPQTNGADHFIPNHHLALITQPVLGIRSRKNDSISNNRRSSSNDSSSFILPINRVEKSQYEKKTNSNSHHESSDSGLDLSLSTNSSVQYSQQHLLTHRPLSALNEDSITDDAYQQQSLRFPIVNLGRNCSFNNTHEQQQNLSGSFSDERLQQQEKTLKRTNDGALFDTSSELHQRTNINKNEFLHHPPPQQQQQQHRSLHDLTNETVNKVLPIHHETNDTKLIDTLSTTNKIIRKPNTSTLKPLRKKSKLHIVVEPSMSSRLSVNEEPIHPMTRITSSSSNQTTPRSIQPINQHIKPKAITPLGHYPNQEQIRAHTNRSMIEKQHTTLLPIPTRKVAIQQMIPFDASPSKVNNLLYRHRVQQHQPTTIIQSNPNVHGVPVIQNLQIAPPSRPKKQTLHALHSDETIDKLTEQEEKKRWNKINQGQVRIKVKDTQEPSKIHRKHEQSEDQIQQTIGNRHSFGSIQRQEDKELSFDKNQKKLDEDIDEKQPQIKTFLTSTPRHQYEHHNNRQRPIINDFYPNSTNKKYEHTQLNVKTIKTQNNINRQQHQMINLPREPAILSYHGIQSDPKQRFHEPTHGSKLTGLITQNKNRPFNPNIQFESEYSQRNTILPSHSRPSKIHSQTMKTPIPIVPHETEQENEKSQIGSINTFLRTTRIQPTNTNIPSRQKEVDRLNNASRMESTQKRIEKNSNGLFQSRSPTAWSVISDHQQLQFSKSSSREESSNENSNTPSRTYRLIITDDQQPVDGRYVIPTNNSQIPSFLDSPSQTSSRHTHPFTCTPDFNHSDHSSPEKQSKEHNSTKPNSTQNTTDHQNSSSSLERFSGNIKFHLPSEKPSISMEEDEISTNYDSDDGWSDDSAELIYVDEHYMTQKKKIIPSSSSRRISQKYYSYQTQQQNVLLQ